MPWPHWHKHPPGHSHQRHRSGCFAATAQVSCGSMHTSVADLVVGEIKKLHIAHHTKRLSQECTCQVSESGDKAVGTEVKLQLRCSAPVAHAHANTSILASVSALNSRERVAAPSAPKVVPAATTNGCLRSAPSLARRSVAL